MAMILSLHTDDVDESERLDAWRARTREVLFEARYALFDPAGLRAEQRTTSVGGVGLSLFACNACAVERTAALVDDHPKRSVLVSIILEGRATYVSPTQAIVVTPGDFLVYRAQDPYLIAFADWTRQLLVEAPEAWLAENGMGLGNVGTVLFDGARQEAAGISAADLAGLFHVLRDPTVDTVALHARIRRALGVLDRHATRAPGRYLADALAFLEQNAFDPQLDVATIATAIGISTRHLSREFAPTGRSPMQRVLELRIAEARRLLELGFLTITEVAGRCGFGSAATFSRAFAAATGSSPRAYRQRCASPPDAPGRVRPAGGRRTPHRR